MRDGDDALLQPLDPAVGVGAPVPAQERAVRRQLEGQRLDVQLRGELARHPAPQHRRVVAVLQLVDDLAEAGHHQLRRWLFDVQGHCVEQPCEPEGGRARDQARQPWYPVEELYGLVWAYLGPPQRKPVLPRYECLEQLEPGEFVEADDRSIGGGGPPVIPCNWLQHYEDLVDPFHVVILLSSFSGNQFVPEMAVMPDVSWDTTGISVRTLSVRKLPDGRTFRRISEAGLPTLRVIPNPRAGRFGPVESLGWVLPVDDHSFRIYVAGRVRERGELRKMRSRPDGRKLWEELSEAEHQLYPGDYEAMVGQGAIAKHSEEHLAATDRGIVMLRRLLRKQLEAVKEGRDPAGVCFDPEAPPVRFSSGNWIE